MVPSSIKIGDTIYINFFGIDIITKYTYKGDGIFYDVKDTSLLKNLDWSVISFSFCEDVAKCKAYLHKLNKLQMLLDKAEQKTIEHKTSIDNLNEKYIDLKRKYPEEFI